MVAIGCMAPLLLGVAGVLAGNWLAGSEGAVWGGIGGLVFGGIILAAVGWVARQIKR